MIFNSSVVSNIYGDDCRYTFAEYYQQNNTMSNNVEYTYFGTRFFNNQSHTSALTGSSVRKYIIPDYYNFIDRTYGLLRYVLVHRSFFARNEFIKKSTFTKTITSLYSR